MGRLELTQFLMISYIAASCVRNFVSSEGSPNVTLIKHNDDVWCVAQGEAATSALAWTFGRGELQWGVSYFTGNKSALDCNFMKPESCSGWKGLTVKTSLEHAVPPLFDYRWNNLPLIQTSGQNEFHDHNNVHLPNDTKYWQVTVSVTAVSDAYIVLCEGQDPFRSACYWIILGGWLHDVDGFRCAIRRCPYGVNNDHHPAEPCRSPVDRNFIRLVNSDRWVHVTISKEDQELKVKLVGEDIPFLRYKDEAPLHPAFLNVRSGNNVPAYFRIQNYTFAEVNRNVQLSSPWFYTQSKQFCVILHYYTPTNARREFSTAVFRIEYLSHHGNTVVGHLEPSEGTWKEKRITYGLDEGWESVIKLTIAGSSNYFFALGSVRKCNPLGDVQVHKVTVLPGTAVSCHPLQYSSSVLTVTDPDPDFTGCEANCLPSCDRTPFNKLISCSVGIIFCQPASKGSACFCNPGYKGLHCAQSCPDNTYGQNCKETCGNCAQNAACDKRSGVCSNGCDGSYRPPMCKITPEAPVNLQATERSAHSIQLMWQHPSITNGKLRQFDIHIKLISSHLRVPEQEVKMPERVLEVKQPSQNYSYEVKDLQPSTEYEVSVRGVTVEPGTAAVLWTKTSLIAPDIGSQLKLGKGPATNTTVQIVIPAADRFLTKDSCYFIIVTSDEVKVVKPDFRSVLETDILWEAEVGKNGRSWIAAKIQPQDEEQEFIVGDNSSVTGGFRNLPLTPGRWYQVTLVAVNRQDGDYKYSIIKLQHPVQTFSEANVEAVWAALLLLLLIPVVVYFIYRKCRHTEPAEYVYDDAVPENMEPKLEYDTGQHVYEEIVPESYIL